MAGSDSEPGKLDGPRYLAVEGPIAAGKTTLARRLADSLDCELLLEDAGANPFLERFYRKPSEAALATQLYFLFQRLQQLGGLHQADLFEGARVADFLIEKDRLFAEATLARDEFELYEQVAAKLAVQAPPPDLVIYLQVPADVLLRRIQQRGLPFEQAIDRAYLERINEAYSQFFHFYDAAPLLIVNAATIDFAHDDNHYKALLDHVLDTHSGRHYFNPSIFR